MTANRERKNRKPIGTGNVLTAEQRPGYVRRYVNDKDGRVDRFKDAGYTTVTEQGADTSTDRAGKPSQLGRVVKRPVGSGIDAVLMEIPEEYYNEDQLAKSERADALEDSMVANTNEGQFGHVTIKR